MDTKIIMTSSAIFLGICGVLLTFMPSEILEFLNLGTREPFPLILQILGALYVGFAMLNWMTKNSMIGGIYNRPILVANFSHFLIGGLALIKIVFTEPELSSVFWVLTVLYALFALIFGTMLFRNPAMKKN